MRNRGKTEKSSKSSKAPKPSRWTPKEGGAVCQPVFTAPIVLPLIFITGFVFIPLGILMLHSANSVNEWSYNYDGCGRLGSRCEIGFDLSEDFSGDVYFYYSLSNYHQNARRYLRNWNAFQLLGDLGCTQGCSHPYKTTKVNLSRSECGNNYRMADGDSCWGNYWSDGECFRPVAPCGAIANSFFTDEFELRNGDGQKVEWTHEGLLWSKEEDRFRNPKPLNGENNLCDSFNKRSIKPPSWRKSPCELDTENPSNNGFRNFDFIIWMNTAAFSSFRKPYRKLRRDKSKYIDGLPAGHYTLIVENHYNVSEFGGQKSFIISTTSWMGGKNRFLGIAYVTVGTLCVVFGLVFVLIHIKFGNTLRQIADLPISGGKPF